MMGARLHRVPLCNAALQVLIEVGGLSGGPDSLVFPGQKPGRPLSDRSLSEVVREMNGVIEDRT